ncbi:hypothetical protein CYLTODRAFT_54754 [Cylindrobasidium torrendii FP15055 ss-10]|uniref:Uncharacterized protein n=1 Tax=Cylindrobasidium torrendii FP15055 ss-10 TaxID=1314674 RepID=A0A0D7BPV6_9AGAR|nr:hypothetical protein CYLTODRAFT_54754 [Cylindrobasidium torrendii FP15055 ss-10]
MIRGRLQSPPTYMCDEEDRFEGLHPTNPFRTILSDRCPNTATIPPPPPKERKRRTSIDTVIGVARSASTAMRRTRQARTSRERSASVDVDRQPTARYEKRASTDAHTPSFRPLQPSPLTPPRPTRPYDPCPRPATPVSPMFRPVTPVSRPGTPSRTSTFSLRMPISRPGTPTFSLRKGLSPKYDVIGSPKTLKPTAKMSASPEEMRGLLREPSGEWAARVYDDAKVDVMTRRYVGNKYGSDSMWAKTMRKLSVR